MSDPARPSPARRVAVEETLPPESGPVHYADAFAVDVHPGDARSPEAILRGALDAMPSAVRRTVLGAWRGLGFELGPADSPQHILGAAIVERTPEVVAILAPGKRATARIVVRRTGDEVRATTFLVAPGREARVLWLGIAPVHRRVVRLLMERTASAGRPDRPDDGPYSAA